MRWTCWAAKDIAKLNLLNVLNLCSYNSYKTWKSKTYFFFLQIWQPSWGTYSNGMQVPKLVWNNKNYKGNYNMLLQIPGLRQGFLSQVLYKSLSNHFYPTFKTWHLMYNHVQLFLLLWTLLSVWNMYKTQTYCKYKSQNTNYKLIITNHKYKIRIYLTKYNKDLAVWQQAWQGVRKRQQKTLCCYLGSMRTWRNISTNKRIQLNF